MPTPDHGWAPSGAAKVGSFRGDLGEAAFGEDVQADVATHLNPFVVLLGEHSAHQADQSGPAGKDADDEVRRWISRFSPS